MSQVAELYSRFHNKCLVCKNEDLKILSKYQEYGLVRCPNCKLVFTKFIPSEKQLKDYYRYYAYSEPSNFSSITISRYNELLEDFERFRKNNLILDIGCGRGEFLEIARSKGWEIVGTEFSKKAIEILQKKDIPAYHGPIKDLNLNKSNFDIITSFEVIEHINNPSEEISSIKNLLRPGGLFYVTTPNFDSISRFFLGPKYNVIEVPEHLIYFTPKTLSYLMKSYDFKEESVLTTGINIGRIREVLFSGNSKLNGKEHNHSDEGIRKLAEENPTVKRLKSITNSILKFYSFGDAMKGYFINS